MGLIRNQLQEAIFKKSPSKKWQLSAQVYKSTQLMVNEEITREIEKYF